jgi:hypothetical protein
MNDPTVDSLLYVVVPAEGVRFDNPPAVEVEQPEFTARLTDGHLRVHPRVHYPSVDAARDVVDPFVRSWEVFAALERGRRELRFRFEKGVMVDRSPSPGHSLSAATIDVTAVAFGSVGFRLTRKSYPGFDVAFRADSLVELMWARLEGHIENREPLQSMAYFCLTAMEAATGSRRFAARQWGIDYEVLDTLGRLTSTKVDPQLPRKALHWRAEELSSAERAWVSATVRAVIRHIGAREAGVTARLEMADLPKL